MCKIHIKCEFHDSFIRSFNHSHIISFLMFCPNHLRHWNSFSFLFFFLKLEVQLHKST